MATTPEASKETLAPEDTTRMYRVENPSMPANPNNSDTLATESVRGQWFSDDLPYVLNYMRKSTKAPGARLLVLDVPKDQMDALHISNHPISSVMEYEPRNWIIPPEQAGKYIRHEIKLDEILGERAGKLGNIALLLAAKNDVTEYLKNVS